MASSYELGHDYWEVQGNEVVRGYGPENWRYRINKSTNELEVLYTYRWDNDVMRASRSWVPAPDNDQTQEARVRLAALLQKGNKEMVTTGELTHDQAAFLRLVKSKNVTWQEVCYVANNPAHPCNGLVHANRWYRVVADFGLTDVGAEALARYDSLWELVSRAEVDRLRQQVKQLQDRVSEYHRSFVHY